MAEGACDALARTWTLIKKKRKEKKRPPSGCFPRALTCREWGWAGTFLQWFLSCPKKGGHVF